MNKTLSKVADCVFPVLLGLVGARWTFAYMPTEWWPSFAFGGIAGFTCCYIVNCIKGR